MTVRSEPGLFVCADPDRLTQMLTNLIANACRYGGGRLVPGGRREGAFVEITGGDDAPGRPRLPRFGRGNR